MAAIGMLHVVRAQEFETVMSADVYAAILTTKSTYASTYTYSGYVLTTLLPVLANDYGISLMNGNPTLAAKIGKVSGCAPFVFSSTERDTYMNRLDPDGFSADGLQSAFEAFNQTDADGVGDVMLEGIRFLRAGLQHITPESVAILTIC